MNNKIETIILRLSKENEKILKEKATKQNVTIEEYIKGMYLWSLVKRIWGVSKMIDFLYNNMEHKLFIILYSILIIYGFYLVLKKKVILKEI